MKTHKRGIKDIREVKPHVRSRKGEREKGRGTSSTRISSLTGEDRKDLKKDAYVWADMIRTRF